MAQLKNNKNESLYSVKKHLHSLGWCERNVQSASGSRDKLFEIFAML